MVNLWTQQWKLNTVIHWFNSTDWFSRTLSLPFLAASFQHKLGTLHGSEEEAQRRQTRRGRKEHLPLLIPLILPTHQAPSASLKASGSHSTEAWNTWVRQISNNTDKMNNQPHSSWTPHLPLTSPAHQLPRLPGHLVKRDIRVGQTGKKKNNWSQISWTPSPPPHFTSPSVAKITGTSGRKTVGCAGQTN